MSYSQNKEEEVVLKYFNGQKGSCLSIGENDGVTLSNVYAFILNGWSATLVEPAPLAFNKLQSLHSSNKEVVCINAAIGVENKKGILFDSGSHLGNGDTSLLSSMLESETEKWKKTTSFNEVEVDVIDFKELLERSDQKKFQFISIDCEGADVDVLRQMNLAELGCVCICIEHNGIASALKEIKRLCNWYKLDKEILYNAENIILTV